MGKGLTIKEHISVPEIENLEPGARDVVERSQWQIIWLLAQGSKWNSYSDRVWLAMDWSDGPRVKQRRTSSYGPWSSPEPGSQTLPR